MGFGAVEEKSCRKCLGTLLDCLVKGGWKSEKEGGGAEGELLEGEEGRMRRREGMKEREIYR